MSGFSGPQAQRGPFPLALLLLLLLGPTLVLAISFHLPVNSRKCLREEIHKDLLVTGAYEITDQSGGAGGLRTHLKSLDLAKFSVNFGDTLGWYQPPLAKKEMMA
ncbi:Transmembrane emp24 domain-containing protein 10, partial [Eschrichtius robustus]|nr:Transmembrane emp24 domain-containing protein 10 [Eschrichtius robustus]